MATVLVADDDNDVAELTRRSLTAAGHQVVVVHDGASALAHAGAVDLAVLDVSMPALDGRQVVGHLRAAPHTRDLPVLVLSSGTTADEISAALDAGADDYLTKPFVPFELKRRVDHLAGTTAEQRRTTRRQGQRRRDLRSA